MKKAVLFSILFCLAATFCFGQKNKTPDKKVLAKTAPAKTAQAETSSTKTIPVKTSSTKTSPAKTSSTKTPPAKTAPAKSASTKAALTKTSPTKISPIKTAPPKPKPLVVQNKPVEAKISDAEWTTLAAELNAENWDKSAPLALQFINRMKIDNEKKQLARLRYLYLYALAGKIFKLSETRNAAEEYAVREELTRASARFTGREFVLPARQFLYDCKAVVNYICTVKGGGNKLLRTTATGKGGAEIHSFDYVSFDEEIDLKGFAENKTFLGGTLRTVEFNDDLKKPWVMRLIFDKGFVRVVV